MNNLEFTIAYELTVIEICAMCEKQGMNLEQTQNWMRCNANLIAERIKSILPSQK